MEQTIYVHITCFDSIQPKKDRNSIRTRLVYHMREDNNFGHCLLINISYSYADTLDSRHPTYTTMAYHTSQYVYICVFDS